MDDEDLQDEPLQITVLDHDTYSANDAIGKVYIDIDPLLCSEAATVISGWLPIYDTIHGTYLKANLCSIILRSADLFCSNRMLVFRYKRGNQRAGEGGSLQRPEPLQTVFMWG